HVGCGGVERRRLLLEQPELEQAAAISGLPCDADDLRHPLRAVDHLPGTGRLLLPRVPTRTGGAIHAQESGCRRVRPVAEHRSLLPSCGGSTALATLAGRGGREGTRAERAAAACGV